MENRAHLIAAALFVLALAVALIASALWLSRSSLDRVGYLVVAHIPVSGLRPDAAVRLRGVEVGKVAEIAFDEHDPRTILVGISVDRRAALTHGTYAQLGYQGVTGLSYIALDDDGSDTRRLAADAREPPRIELRPSMIDEIGGSGQELLRHAALAARRLDRLLSDENLARLAGALQGSEAATQRIAALAQALQPAAQGLPALEQRADASLARLQALVADADALSAELRQRLAALDQVGQSAQTLGNSGHAIESALIDGTLPRLNATVDDLARTAHSLDRLVHDLEARPQALVFGRPPPPAGPGEPGYSAPGGRP